MSRFHNHRMLALHDLHVRIWSIRHDPSSETLQKLTSTICWNASLELWCNLSFLASTITKMGNPCQDLLEKWIKQSWLVIYYFTQTSLHQKKPNHLFDAYKVNCLLSLSQYQVLQHCQNLGPRTKKWAP